MNKQTSLSQIIADTLQVASLALGALAQSSHEQLVEVVSTIQQATGRVVVTGMGKSGLAAQKLAATLNSTGTPSIYMHAGDAIHGDVGAVQQADVVIVVSKSGSNDEIKKLLPALKGRGAHIVAWTSTEHSHLALYADSLVYIPVICEADPHGLAPTTSTIAHIAMGDALAMALQSANDWSPASFAALHPGGSLGRRLHVHIKELVDHTRRPAVTVHTVVSDVILAMSAGRMGAVAVLGDDQQLLGIVTDGDLRRMLQSHVDMASLTASDIMTAGPVTAPPTALAYEVLHQLEQKNISQILIIEHGEYVGMVHLHDLISVGF